MQRKDRFIFFLSDRLMNPAKQNSFLLIDYYKTLKRPKVHYQLKGTSLPVIFQALRQQLYEGKIELIALYRNLPDYWECHFRHWWIPVDSQLRELVKVEDYRTFVFQPDDYYYAIGVTLDDSFRYSYCPVLWRSISISRLY